MHIALIDVCGGGSLGWGLSSSMAGVQSAGEQWTLILTLTAMYNLHNFEVISVFKHLVPASVRGPRRGKKKMF